MGRLRPIAPALSATVEALHSAVETRVTKQRVHTVLIVDDDEPIRESLLGLFQDAGYHVLQAGDGVEALQLLRAQEEPLVVLLDLRMPGLNGAGVLGAVAADRVLSTRHAYVLMSANMPTLTLAFAHLLRELDVPVIEKPFDIDTLLDIVARAAARLAARQHPDDHHSPS